MASKGFVCKVTDPGLWCGESGFGGEKLDLQEGTEQKPLQVPVTPALFTTINSAAPTIWELCV